jgi:hypothetical protein
MASLSVPFWVRLDAQKCINNVDCDGYFSRQRRPRCLLCLRMLAVPKSAQTNGTGVISQPLNRLLTQEGEELTNDPTDPYRDLRESCL